MRFGRKRSQRTASEHPACDRHTAFIQRALRCSFSAHVRGIGCPIVAAIHPGASIHASFRRASAGVGCVVFGTCGRRQIVLIALVGREGHGLAGPQQVRLHVVFGRTIKMLRIDRFVPSALALAIAGATS